MVREADPSRSLQPAPADREPVPGADRADPRRALLRQVLLEARSRMTPEARASQVDALTSRLDALVGRMCRSAQLKVVGVYWPIRGEPDLRHLYADWQQRGAVLALPVVVASAAPLRFSRWAPGDELYKGLHGVPIPRAEAWVDPQLVIIPCVGFDDRGYRLGYGGGYYDRTLADRPRLAVGVAWGESRLTEFEPHAGDFPLDAIVTPERVWGRFA